MPVFSPVHRDTKKPRGFTFCQYRREEDAADAVRGMSGRVSQGVELSGWVRQGVGLSGRVNRGWIEQEDESGREVKGRGVE